MMSRVGAHLRSNAVAYLALFVALTSTSVAAVALQNNSVLSRNIKNGEVKRPDIARNAVDSSKVADRSIRQADLAPGLNAATLGHLAPSAFALAGHNHDAQYVNEGQPNSVTSGMVVDQQRSVSIPLSSFMDCSGSGAPLDFSSGADAAPDYTLLASAEAYYIRWDNTTGSEDNHPICTQITVPPDYAGNGVLRIAASKSGDTAPAVEELFVSTNGNVGDTGTLSASLASYDVTPGPLTAGGRLVINIVASGSGPPLDDSVDVHAVDLVYDSAQ